LHQGLPGCRRKDPIHSESIFGKKMDFLVGTAAMRLAAGGKVMEKTDVVGRMFALWHSSEVDWELGFPAAWAQLFL
jgi:hypothetical protein